MARFRRIVRAMIGMAGRLSVVAFILGVGFAGILTTAARGRRLARLSIPRVTALGVGAGLLYFGFLAMNGGRHWSLGNAVGNLVLLTVLGGGSAAGTLLLARRGGAELGPGEESRILDDVKSGD